MLDFATFRSDRHRSAPQRWTSPPGALELFRLRGDSLELRGLAIETSFGYGFGLELDAELILMHLQRTVESMVDYAIRMESALIAQGWHVSVKPQPGGPVYDVQ
jgi:hypothetical protein